jgi:hypothetical protein
MKYEYQTLMAEAPEVNEEELNEMGEKGWLLVAIYPVERLRKRQWIYIFAREVKQQ